MYGVGAKDVAAPYAPKKRVIPENNLPSLILFVDVCVKSVFQLGRKFPWPRPQRCPRCQGRLWGHGFVEAYLDGFHQPLWLRRYRCADCLVVFRMRPKGYWRRFQAPIWVIRSSISRRLKAGRWPPGLSRSRQGHWLRALVRRVLAYLGLQWQGRWLAGFDRLWEMGLVPVSRSI
jgi:hypothetical protein